MARKSRTPRLMDGVPPAHRIKEELDASAAQQKLNEKVAEFLHVAELGVYLLEHCEGKKIRPKRGNNDEK